MKVISHACAWKANELYENKEFSISLSNKAISELANNAAVLTNDFTKVQSDNIECTTLKNECLQIAKLIESGPGITRIENFPIQHNDLEKTKQLYWHFGKLIGIPVSQSPAGDLMMSVMDQGYQFKSGQSEARGSNSKQSLPFHTDLCDALSFLCINDATKGGDNLFVSSVSIQNEMAQTRPDLLAALYQPFYFCPQKFDIGNKNKYFSIPIFSQKDGHFSSFYVSLLIELAQELDELPKLSTIQKEALGYLEELANSEHMKVRYRQNPGEILILNNHVIYHARDEFDDADGDKRHLLRLWLSLPNSRPLIEDYGVIYNSVAAGKIRGGVALA
jgi:hypothetical protein